MTTITKTPKWNRQLVGSTQEKERVSRRESLKELTTNFPDIDPAFKEGDLAVMLGCSKSKLQRDRWLGVGIPFHRVGRSIFYLLSDIKKYIGERRVVPTGKPKLKENSQNQGGDK